MQYKKEEKKKKGEERKKGKKQSRECITATLDYFVTVKKTFCSKRTGKIEKNIELEREKRERENIWTNIR